jgi:hypothetical protein
LAFNGADDAAPGFDAAAFAAQIVTGEEKWEQAADQAVAEVRRSANHRAD